MKKITSLLTIIVFGATSLLHGVEKETNPSTTDVQPPAQQVTVDGMPNDTSTTFSEETAGVQVGKAADDGTDSATRDTWIKFGIAAVAIAVAVTALVLVSNNKGKKS